MFFLSGLPNKWKYIIIYKKVKKNYEKRLLKEACNSFGFDFFIWLKNEKFIVLNRIVKWMNKRQTFKLKT